MASEKLDLSGLGGLVAAERRRRGLSLRDAAKDVGVPFNTFTRVEKGHVPDLPKFKRFVEWCGADIQRFFETHEKTEATPDLIAGHLHSDRNLRPEAAEQIAGIVKDLYRSLAQPQEISAVHLRAATTFRPEAARALGMLLDDLQKALTEEPLDDPA